MDNRQWWEKLISPSRLDEFLQFQSGCDFKGDEYTLEAYIDKLLKIQAPSSMHKMNAGTAGHWILEHLNYGVKVNRHDAVPVENQTWQVIFDTDINVQIPVIREAWVRGNFCGVNVRGKVDAIDAVDIHDHKFTGAIDIDKYMSSMQWKMYLLMTERSRFIYNLFTVKVDDYANIVTIKDYQRLVLYAYDGMREEVDKTVSDYKEFLLSIKSLLELRISEYNALIDSEVARILERPLITIKDQLITILNNSKLKELE